MKFPHFIYDYVTIDDWECLENILNYSNSKDYLGFDYPDFKELNNSESTKWDELITICKNYINTHNLKIIRDKHIYCDLEKGYEEREVIFLFDNKYYKIYYDSGPYTCPFEYGYPDEVKEVFPHSEMITKYY